MDIADVRRILDAGGNYVTIKNDSDMPVDGRVAELDGSFTIRELEAAISIMLMNGEHEWSFTRNLEE